MVLFIEKILNKISKSYYSKLFKKKYGSKAKILGKIYTFNPNVHVGKNVIIYPNVAFNGDGEITIGDNVSIGYGTIFFSSKQGGVKIGNDTMIAAQCYIIDTDHGIVKDKLIRDQSNKVEPINIGDDVWLAAGVKVLKGSSIMSHAVIGAQAVVKGAIDENGIAVGIPAKVVKYRK